MTEQQQLKNRIAVNEVKIGALRAYGKAFEASLHDLALGLARDGYSKEEIETAIRATMPTLQTGCDEIQAAIDEFAAKALADG